MTEAEKWKARAEQVYAHIYLDVPAGHHLHETNVATLKAALAEAYAAGREEGVEAERHWCWKSPMKGSPHD